MEKWRTEYNKLIADVKQAKMNAYDYYHRWRELSYQYSRFELRPTDYNDTATVTCSKCGTHHWLRFSAEPEVAVVGSINDDDLARLPLPGKDVLLKVAARMRIFKDFAKFEDLFIDNDSNKASVIVSKAVEGLSVLNSQKSEIVRLTETMREIPEFLERKAHEWRMVILERALASERKSYNI